MKIKKVSALIAITGAVTAAVVTTAKLANDSREVVNQGVLAEELVEETVSLDAITSNSGVVITEAKGDQESLYATFKGVSGASGYNAYVKKGNGSYVKLDTQLVRTYSGSYRVDAVGLSAGTYTLKIVPVINGSETTDAKKCAMATNLSVVSYDRTGFGFTKNSKNSSGDASGAYNADGTLDDMCWNTDECSYCPFIEESDSELFGKMVWNSTIKKKDIESYGWDANPWVWVIEFERIER